MIQPNISTESKKSPCPSACQVNYVSLHCGKGLRSAKGKRRARHGRGGGGGGGGGTSNRNKNIGNEDKDDDEGKSVITAEFEIQIQQEKETCKLNDNFYFVVFFSSSLVRSMIYLFEK